MIGLLRIALGHVIERGLGQRRLELHNRVCCLRRIGIAVACELEDVRHMDHVLLARVFEALLRLQVVVAVRQSKAGGANVGDRLRRIMQIGDGLQSKRNVHRQALQLHDHLLHACDIVDSIDLGQHRLHRSHAGGIDRRHVRARRIEVAGQLR